jgi:outer membrane protein insertion porin family
VGTGGSIVDDDLHWRSVVGASLLWSSPIGPLRLDFTKALEKESYDKEQTFDLTITTEF